MAPVLTCCPGVALPTVLHLQVYSSTGPVADVTLTWDPAGANAEGGLGIYDSGPIVALANTLCESRRYVWECLGTVWRLRSYSPGGISTLRGSVAAADAVCDPFFVDAAYDTAGCYIGSGPALRFSVTE